MLLFWNLAWTRAGFFLKYSFIIFRKDYLLINVLRKQLVKLDRFECFQFLGADFHQFLKWVNYIYHRVNAVNSGPKYQNAFISSCIIQNGNIPNWLISKDICVLKRIFSTYLPLKAICEFSNEYLYSCQQYCLNR